MKKFFKFVAFAVLFLTVSRCSTDVDIYADYKDITVVFGVADVASDTTWVKITKAFVGPGNALVIAQNPDSSNYPEKLNAQLIGYKTSGDELPPIVLDTMTIHNKQRAYYIVGDNGDTVFHPFYGPDQLMYYAVGELKSDYSYRLQIDNNSKIITGESPLIGNFSITAPVNRVSFPTNPILPDPTVGWTSVKNGKRYEVTMTFHYKELIPGSIDTAYKSISWYVGSKKSAGLNGGEELEISYSGSNFFTLLQDKLEPIPFVQRWAGLVDIEIAAGSQVLDTYLSVNSSSSSLLEEVPVYSNMDGAIGIFAARHNILKSFRMATNSETELVNNYDLGFHLSQ